jgi:hypothetical protein
MGISDGPALPHIDVVRKLHLPVLDFARVIASGILPELGSTRFALFHQSLRGTVLQATGLRFLSKKSNPAAMNSIKRMLEKP